MATTAKELGAGSLRGLPGIVELARALQEAERLGDPAALDLRHTDGGRYSPRWALILTNLLLGRYADLPVHVRLPRTPGAALQLARGGLAYAAARHRHLSLIDETDPWELDRWRVDWSPAATQQERFVFQGLPRPQTGRAAEDQPQALDRDLLAFLNPDRSPMTMWPFSQGQTSYSWLRQLAPRPAIDKRNELQKLRIDVSRIVRELLENIRLHARLSLHDHSFISSFATRGPASNGGTRLYVTVLDTGAGMPSMLQTHYPHLDHQSAKDAAWMVERPLNNDYPQYGRGRGRGLARCINRVRNWQGRIFLATGLPSGNGTILVDAPLGNQEPLSAHVEMELPVKGTVIIFTLQLGNFQSPRRRISGRIEQPRLV